MRASWKRIASRRVEEAVLKTGHGGRQGFEIGAIAVLAGKLCSQCLQRLEANEIHVIGDFLEAGDLYSLPVLEGCDVGACFHQALGGAGVQPGDAATERLDKEAATPQILAIHIRDFELPAWRRLESAGYFADLPVVDVKPGNGVIALGFRGFFLDVDGATGFVEFHDSVTAWVNDRARENGRAVFPGKGRAHQVKFSVEDIVSQDQDDTVFIHEGVANNEGLRYSFGVRLLGILNSEPEL